MHPVRIGIVVFAAAVLLAPLYAAAGYHWTQHLISQLAAQQAPHHEIMSMAFIVLGVGALWSAVKRWRKCGERRAWAFAGFGLFIAGAGVFAHRPMDPGLPFDAFAHQLHGAMAALSCTCLSIGFALDAIVERGKIRRIRSATLAALCLAMPLAMLAWSQVQGAIQRAMYALVLAALWFRWNGEGPTRSGMYTRDQR